MNKARPGCSELESGVTIRRNQWTWEIKGTETPKAVVSQRRYWKTHRSPPSQIVYVQSCRQSSGHIPKTVVGSRFSSNQDASLPVSGPREQSSYRNVALWMPYPQMGPQHKTPQALETALVKWAGGNRELFTLFPVGGTLQGPTCCLCIHLFWNGYTPISGNVGYLFNLSLY